MLALPTDLHSLIGISPIFFRGKYGENPPGKIETPILLLLFDQPSAMASIKIDGAVNSLILSHRKLAKFPPKAKLRAEKCVLK